MDNAEYKKGPENADDRRFALWASIVIAALFLIQLFHWLFGSGHWDDLLLLIVVLIVQLTQYFQLKGLAKLFSQVMTWGLTVVIIVMLIVRW